MGFKDLFIKSDENADDKTKKVETSKESSKTKFPVDETTKESTNFFNFGKTTPTTTPVNTSGKVSEEHLAKAIEIYKSGFESLNQPGYDFYEYYMAIIESGAEASNAMAFTMAFNMAKSMNKTISKDSLVQQSEFYSSEIIKNYNDYIAKGNAKKQELLGQKNNENQSLLGELEMLKQQAEAIKTQIQDRESKLNTIGGKYEPKISEIDSKLAANDLAKNKIIQSIEQVKQGIINNLK